MLTQILLNSTSIETLTSLANGFFTFISTLLGGIFGLYFILAVVKIVNGRKLIKEIRLIRLKVEEISKKLEHENPNRKKCI